MTTKADRLLSEVDRQLAEVGREEPASRWRWHSNVLRIVSFTALVLFFISAIALALAVLAHMYLGASYWYVFTVSLGLVTVASAVARLLLVRKMEHMWTEVLRASAERTPGRRAPQGKRFARPRRVP